MKTKLLFLIVVINLLTILKLYSQQKNISGYVFEQGSKQAVAGCVIYEAKGHKAVSTNENGFFSISFPKNEQINLRVSYIGFDMQNISFKLQKDTSIHIYLIQNNAIDEVTILTQSSKNNGNNISINSRQIRLLPTLAGEADLIKILQLTPGIQQGKEGSSEILVRGGSPDQNLILLDDVPIYYINHLGGFVSVFNPDIINDVTLIKGGFPAYYGGKLSSVIDIKTNNGIYDKYTGSATIGMLSSKLFLQGPILKDKISFYVSGRRFMYDLLTIPFSKLAFDDYIFGYNFYDFNIKINYNINPTTNINFSSYIGNDNLKFMYRDKIFKGDDFLKWGNYVYSFRFNKSLSKKIFLKALIANSDYHYSQYESYEDDVIKSSKETGSNINDVTFKVNTDIFLANNIFLQVGLQSVYHQFKPGVSSFYSEKKDTIIDDRIYNNFNSTAIENALFLQSKINFLKIFEINAGLRLTNFIAEDSTFYRFEPRFIFSIKLKKIDIQITYSKMNQYIHLLSGAGIVMPTDFWVPSNKDFIPENSNLYTLGFDKFKINKFKISTAVYYKTFENLIEYKEGVTSINGLNDWKNVTDNEGNGYSYGIETLIKYNTKKIDSWLSYTYSRSFRQFEQQNLGELYTYKYDKPHNLIITGIYKLSEKYSFSASWTFASGLPITLATGVYNVSEDIENGIVDFVDAELYTPKNSYRMKAYHRLDLSVNRTKKKKRGNAVWNFSIYNAYNRLNANYYYYGCTSKFVNGNTVYSDEKLLSMSFFPILPSISFTRNF